MNKKFQFSFVLWIVLNMSGWAQYPTIHENHPRLFIDSDRMSWLQTNITTSGDSKNTYDDMMYAYNNWWINDPQLYLDGSNQVNWTWDWNSEWASEETQLTVYIFKMTQDPLALSRCEFIAQSYINLINTTDFTTIPWYEKETLLRQLSDAGSILLDWAYNDLNSSIRDQLAQAHFLMNQELMNTFILSSAGNSFVSSHNTWNHIFANQNCLALYNASGLTDTQKSTVLNWFNHVYDKHTQQFIPVWDYYRDDDGGWNWGAAYAMWSLIDQYTLFENMRIGTNKNFFEDLDWLPNSINQYMYYIQPDGRSLHLGDGETQLKADIVTYLHARHYNDPRSLWLTQEYSTPSLLTNTMEKYSKLLYKDFEMTPIARPEMPLDWWADKVGLSVSRSSWENDAAMVTFFNSPSKKAAHEHRDNNSFTIFKNKPLLIDSGFYDSYQSEHYNNYYSRTIAHNSIIVFDATENYYNVGIPVSNDGGQIESTYLQNYNAIFLPENQRGTWIKYVSEDTYSYHIADAQLSYNPNKLDLFRRRLFYLIPDKVIVLDHLHLNQLNGNQRDVSWIGHFVNKPQMSGNMTQNTVPNHIETFDGKNYFAENGTGNLAIKTLLPAQSNTTLIGGAGYEYWVNGMNYPPSSNPDPAQNIPGSWRIEVRPQTVEDNPVFLHTIDIGDTSQPAVAGGILIQNEYSIGVDWDNTLILLDAHGEIDQFYHELQGVTGNRTIRLLAADLANDLFDIFVDGNLTQVLPSGENGILDTNLVLAPGLHTIVITLNTIGLDDSNTSNELHIFPNPSQNYASIPILQANYSEIQVLITTVQGASIDVEMSLENDHIKIVTDQLPVGMYLITVYEGQKMIRNGKLLVE